ncbi:MAG TPA: hypothetical protein VLI55_03350 [Bryobacteraceae bacterium]|nr:hypothetical protein [Bryobacteraceae bacterium]
MKSERYKPREGGGANGFGLVGEFVSVLQAAKCVDSRFKRRDAEQTPLGIGDGLNERLFAIGFGLPFGEGLAIRRS